MPGLFHFLSPRDPKTKPFIQDDVIKILKGVDCSAVKAEMDRFTKWEQEHGIERK